MVVVVSLPEKEHKELVRVEAALSRKWNEWLKIYHQDINEDGIAVVMKPGTKEKKVWDELVALRLERNNLISALLDEG